MSRRFKSFRPQYICLFLSFLTLSAFAMPSTFTHEFDTPVYKGKVSFNTGIFINGQFVDGSDDKTIE